MIHDSDASRRHRQRRLTSGEGLNIQETMSAIGKGIGTFLGVLDTGEEDASLEIFRERERRLAKVRLLYLFIEIWRNLLLLISC